MIALLSAGAGALAVHAAVNARLLRVPTATRTDARVSVLLPVRDEAPRVAACVRSLLGQTGVDLEVVVVDDGSTDGTADVVREYADVRLIETPNQGLSAARNAGIAADRVARLAESTDQLVQQDARPAAQDLRRSMASIQQTTANIDALVADARPGVQSLTKSTLPEVNRLVRDLRDLTSSLENVSQRVESGGVSGVLGQPKLPDHKPGRSR